jgi:myo-inositol-1-phosphate synthase
MNEGRFGIWLIGAWGHLATATAIGLAGLQRRDPEFSGLVSDLPLLENLNLVDWDVFVLGGHEIRRTSSHAEARSLLASEPFADAGLLNTLFSFLATFDKNVRTGTLIHVGPAIEARATAATLKTRGETPRAAIERITADLRDFRKSHSLEHVIVVNVASTEPATTIDGTQLSWTELADVLDRGEQTPLPASALYAIAAMQSGCTYFNFAASLGSDLPACSELAARTGTLHMGRDGETDVSPLTKLRGRLWREGDSIRGAASILDLVRFGEREHRRRKSGLMTFLSPFFRCPQGATGEDHLVPLARLHAWANDATREP